MFAVLEGSVAPAVELASAATAAVAESVGVDGESVERLAEAGMPSTWTEAEVVIGVELEESNEEADQVEDHDAAAVMADVDAAVHVVDAQVVEVEGSDQVEVDVEAVPVDAFAFITDALALPVADQLPAEPDAVQDSADVTL